MHNPTHRTLRGRTLVISGGSRGIGEAIALRAARDGADIALLAKTSRPHPKLPGTIHTAAAAIEAAGGRALPLVGDIRDDAFVEDAVAAVAGHFGRIDIVVNNASALDLSPSDQITMKRYDLLQDINARGTFHLSTAALPHLRESDNPHILTLSPPITLDPHWYDSIGTAYTISKFSMTLATMGLAREQARYGIAANTLWPRTTIDTAAVRNLLGPELIARSRDATVMADAAHAILTRPAAQTTGQCLIDDEVLRAEGVADLARYRRAASDEQLELDFWMHPAMDSTRSSTLTAAEKFR
jgi:citronellol/citronellal dehydrogenase